MTKSVVYSTVNFYLEWWPRLCVATYMCVSRMQILYVCIVLIFTMLRGKFFTFSTLSANVYAIWFISVSLLSWAIIESMFSVWLLYVSSGGNAILCWCAVWFLYYYFEVVFCINLLNWILQHTNKHIQNLIH